MTRGSTILIAITSTGYTYVAAVFGNKCAPFYFYFTYLLACLNVWQICVFLIFTPSSMSIDANLDE